MDSVGALASVFQERPTRNEILACLVSGLGFLHGDTSPEAQRLAIRVLANIVIEHLDVCGFEIVRKPGGFGLSEERTSFCEQKEAKKLY